LQENKGTILINQTNKIQTKLPRGGKPEQILTRKKPLGTRNMNIDKRTSTGLKTQRRL